MCVCVGGRVLGDRGCELWGWFDLQVGLLRVSRAYLGITQRPVFAVPSGVCGRLAFAKFYFF